MYVENAPLLTRVDLFFNLLLALGEQEELETENWLASTSARFSSFDSQDEMEFEKSSRSKIREHTDRARSWWRPDEQRVVCRVRFSWKT